MCNHYIGEKIWFDRALVEAAESNFYSIKYSSQSVVASSPPKTPKAASSTLKQAGETASVIDDVNKIRDVIKNALDDSLSPEDMQRLSKLEKENQQLQALISSLEKRVAALEVSGPSPQAAPVKPAPAANADDDDDDDDIDLFGSSDEEEDAAAEKLKAERVAMYNEKKAKKAVTIAKSTIILDVKPWDDETDGALMEKSVRSVEMDGLLWGASKFVEVGYGIKKLQITCVVEDDKVGTDDLEERLTAFEDYVQSMDIVAFNKI